MFFSRKHSGQFNCRSAKRFAPTDRRNVEEEGVDLLSPPEVDFKLGGLLRCSLLGTARHYEYLVRGLDAEAVVWDHQLEHPACMAKNIGLRQFIIGQDLDFLGGNCFMSLSQAHLLGENILEVCIVGVRHL